VLVERDAWIRSANKLGQRLLALLDWQTPQVLGIQFDQVERDQHRIVAVSLAADQIEHSQPTLIGDNRLTVEQERVCGQSRHRIDRKRKPRREIMRLLVRLSYSLPPRFARWSRACFGHSFVCRGYVAREQTEL
jgi:hypothetical protein